MDGGLRVPALLAQLFSCDTLSYFRPSSVYYKYHTRFETAEDVAVL